MEHLPFKLDKGASRTSRLT